MTAFGITLGYVAVALLIGISSARGKIMSRFEEWSLANRKLGFLVTYFLNAAGIISAFSMLGAPGFAYNRGVAICYLIVYVSLQQLIAYFVAPRVWELGKNLGHITQAQAVAERYESQILGAVFAAVTSLGLIAYATTQAVGCAHVLNLVSGGTVPFWLGASLVMVSMAVYLYFGGMRAIGWTNVFQGILMFAISWSAGTWISRKIFGNWWLGAIYAEILKKAPSYLTLPGPKGDWSCAFWTSSILVSALSIWPTGWAWWMGAKDPKILRRSIALMPLFLTVMVPTISLGFAAVLRLPDLLHADQAALALAIKTLPSSMVGLLGAGVLAAAMSSAEPCLLITSVSYTADILAPVFKLSKNKQAKVARIVLVVLIVGVVLPLTLLQPKSMVHITLIGYGFLGQSFPALLGIFVWPRATRAGAMAGLVGGFAVTLFLNIWHPNPLGIHSGAWGLFVNLVLFLSVSLLTKPHSPDVFKRFFVHFQEEGKRSQEIR